MMPNKMKVTFFGPELYLKDQIEIISYQQFHSNNSTCHQDYNIFHDYGIRGFVFYCHFHEMFFQEDYIVLMTTLQALPHTFRYHNPLATFSENPCALLNNNFICSIIWVQYK